MAAHGDFSAQFEYSSAECPSVLSPAGAAEFRTFVLRTDVWALAHTKKHTNDIISNLSSALWHPNCSQIQKKTAHMQKTRHDIVHVRLCVRVRLSAFVREKVSSLSCACME